MIGFFSHLPGLLGHFPVAVGAGEPDFLTGDHPAGPHIVPEGIASLENIERFTLFAFVICVLVVWLLYLLSKWLIKAKDTKKYLKFWFGFAWVLAFVVYDVGMYTGQYISLLTNAPMAVIHAFETFVLGSDVSAIHEPFHSSWVFMTCFSFSHALSAFVSTLFLIKVFGFNVVQKWRLYKERRGPVKDETFVIWGVNGTSYKMAASIRNHFEEKGDGSYRTVVVKTVNDAEETAETAVGFNRIFEIISLRDTELQDLQDLQCLIAASGQNLEHSGEDGDDILRRQLELKSLAAILTSRTAERIHILLLSDDETRNLHDVSVLLKDKTLNDFIDASKEHKVIFYCHARYNGVHRVIEDVGTHSRMEVRLIDSSHINVELLKTNDEVLPVNFVDVESDGSVSSDFNAMVIGFSEVGQDMVRFLYEFGAFVKTGATPEKAERSGFHLDVVDNRMQEKAGAFIANSPAIKPSVAFIPELRNPRALIELHNEDCRSIRFYRMLESRIKSLNYIVIATEDDELNMTMGVRIFRTAVRYRDNMEKFCILVRIKDDSDGRFEKIASFYNRLWAAQEENNVEGRKQSEKCLRNAECRIPLFIFGRDRDVYTYGNIIDETILKQAIMFKERYSASVDKNYVEPAQEMDRQWYKEQEKALQTGSPYHPAYSNLMRLRRTRGQDVANSLHRRTKELLRDKAMSKNDFPDFDWASLQRCSEQTSYSTVDGGPVNPEIARLLTVMAQTEHLRWTASHEILGYVHDASGKNEIRLHHDCLTEWENLEEPVRSYDNDVVDLTLGIIDSKRKIKDVPK